MQIRKAQKAKSKLRIGMMGASGSGKTYSALLLASGMTDWTKVLVIDTENHSADLYDHLGDYSVITLDAPYSPERYVQAIQMGEESGFEVIIIDSISHVWEGTGGILEIVDKLGGRFQDWAKATPRYKKLVNAILRSKAHIITTSRTKTEYSVEKDDKNKTRVRKVGTKDVNREGFDYEMTISFSIDINHLAEATKDRTSMFIDQPEFMISKETGKRLAEWASKGIDPANARDEKLENKLFELGDQCKHSRDQITKRAEGFFSTSFDKLTNEQLSELISMYEGLIAARKKADKEKNGK